MNYNKNNKNNGTTNYRTSTYASTSKPWAPKPEDKSKYTPKSAYSNNTETKFNKNSKSNDFMSAMEKTQNGYYDIAYTENGAAVYSTSGSKLLDLNFSVSQLRGKTDREISEKFRAAYKEEPMTAIKWLFYCRDAREGIGERNLFKVCLNDLARNGQAELVNNLVTLIGEYGRWDDMLPLLDTRCKKTVLDTITKQLYSDLSAMKENKPVSLAAKWVPSQQCSNSDNLRYANMIQAHMGLSPRNYRKTLSSLRAYIDVVERKMSSNNWQSIDFETVPSKANLLYNNAFLRHDEERRRAYLGALEKGEAKINSSVAFPHDIVHKYAIQSGWTYRLKTYDAALEAMWKSLPNLVKNGESTIVVADGSGSMSSTVPGTSVSCLEVANALAIYFAERCKGPYKNRYITFSSKPQFVNLSSSTLHDNLLEAARHNECSNTNIEAVFDLMLKTAVQNHMRQEDIPSNILILSDMQFDSCVCCARNSWGIPDTLFDTISKRWESAGYHMPRLVFWNLNCRSTKDTIPVQQNKYGVALLSGFSVNLCKMVMSAKTDPYECLLEVLNSERYNAVEKVVKKTWGI